MRLSKPNNANGRSPFLCWMTLAALCLLTPACRAQETNNTPGLRRTPQASAAANFAVADFDGDRNPDIAAVEMERGGSGGDSRYCIRFRLASGGTQVFGLTAPAGGLQIIASDVNGDQALDLLVRTAFEHQEVAVFLNDGHGNFTPVDAASYSASFWGFENRCRSEPAPVGDSAALLRLQTSVQGVPEHCRSIAPQEVGLIHSGVPSSGSRLFRVSWLGRAPPAFILQA